MSQSFQKCTIRFNQRFFFLILFCNLLRRVVVTAMFMSVYKNLMYSPFIVFLKNEVVDVQNEVAVDICLDLTCA